MFVSVLCQEGRRSALWTGQSINLTLLASICHSKSFAAFSAAACRTVSQFEIFWG